MKAGRVLEQGEKAVYKQTPMVVDLLLQRSRLSLAFRTLYTDLSTDATKGLRK